LSIGLAAAGGGQAGPLLAAAACCQRIIARKWRPVMVGGRVTAIASPLNFTAAVYGVRLLARPPFISVPGRLQALHCKSCIYNCGEKSYKIAQKAAVVCV